MITIVKKLDKTYGGYDYVEYDTEKKVYKTGQTRAHRGHYSLANSTEIEVRTLRELKELKAQLESRGYKEDKEW